MTTEEAIKEISCVIALSAGDPEDSMHPDAVRQREAWDIVKELAEFGQCTREAAQDE